jgi:hypothetical protein
LSRSHPGAASYLLFENDYAKSGIAEQGNEDDDGDGDEVRRDN